MMGPTRDPSELGTNSGTGNLRCHQLIVVIWSKLNEDATQVVVNGRMSDGDLRFNKPEPNHRRHLKSQLK